MFYNIRLKFVIWNSILFAEWKLVFRDTEGLKLTEQLWAKKEEIEWWEDDEWDLDELLSNSDIERHWSSINSIPFSDDPNLDEMRKQLSYSKKEEEKIFAINQLISSKKLSFDPGNSPISSPESISLSEIVFKSRNLRSIMYQITLLKGSLDNKKITKEEYKIERRKIDKRSWKNIKKQLRNLDDLWEIILLKKLHELWYKKIRVHNWVDVYEQKDFIWLWWKHLDEQIKQYPWMPKELVLRLIRKESAFNPYARPENWSAHWFWQIIDTTFAEIQTFPQFKDHTLNRFDPEDQISAILAYYNKMHELKSGWSNSIESWEEAIVYYHTGPNLLDNLSESIKNNKLMLRTAEKYWVTIKLDKDITEADYYYYALVYYLEGRPSKPKENYFKNVG